MSVYEYKIDKSIEYITAESTLRLPITIMARNMMIEAFALYKGVKYFNDRVVRLENIGTRDDKIQVALSLIDFFDFFIINIVSAQLDGFVQYLKENDIYYKIADDIECLRQYRIKMLQVNDFDSLVKSGLSSNALAISVLLTDKNGDYLLTQRGKKTGISEMLHSVTATGAIEEKDYHSVDAIKNCVIRELKEELNLFIDAESLDVCSIVAGKNKLQPIVIVNGRIRGKFSELIVRAKEAVDFEHEVNKLIVADRKLLKTILCKEKFTEAIEYHLQSVVI